MFVKKKRKEKPKLFVALSAYYVWSLAAADHTDLKKILFCSFSIITFNQPLCSNNNLSTMYTIVFMLFSTSEIVHFALHINADNVCGGCTIIQMSKRFICFCDLSQ